MITQVGPGKAEDNEKVHQSCGHGEAGRNQGCKISRFDLFLVMGSGVLTLDWSWALITYTVLPSKKN